jgi:hypothetical protein
MEVDIEGKGTITAGIRASVWIFGGDGGWFGGSLVGTGLVEVAHVHGDGTGKMTTDLGRSKVRPGGQMASIDGGAPSGDSRGK